MQGSAMIVVDHSGKCAAAYAYDEFGTDLYGNQGQFQPFGYTGYQKDAVAGTYYAQAREYDAWAGRFVSEDIIKGSTAYPKTVTKRREKYQSKLHMGWRGFVHGRQRKKLLLPK